METPYANYAKAYIPDLDRRRDITSNASIQQLLQVSVIYCLTTCKVSKHSVEFVCEYFHGNNITFPIFGTYRTDQLLQGIV